MKHYLRLRDCCSQRGRASEARAASTSRHGGVIPYSTRKAQIELGQACHPLHRQKS